MTDKIKLRFAFFFFLGVLIGLFLSFGIFYFSDKIPELSKVQKVQNISDCSQFKYFMGKVNCINDYVSTFYKYNESQKFKWDVNLNDIKENGGVCYHYAILYSEFAKQIGLYGEEINMDMGDVRHAVAIISDNKGNYCVADQTNLMCN